MNLRIVYLLLTFVQVITPNIASAELGDDLTWELARDRDDIQVYTASVPDSKHKAVRAVMTIPNNVRELVALVMDTDACPDWAALCKESRVAEMVSPTEAYIYTYNDLPWPVRDRDAVGHVNWVVADSGVVSMTAKIAEGVVEPHKRALRLTTGITSWTFSPQTDGSTQVVSFAHLDPGGTVPSWITNMLLVDSPWDTMAAMRSVVASGRYEAADVPFSLTEATAAPTD